MNREDVFTMSKEKALENFDLLMKFQYGAVEESEQAFQDLQDVSKELVVICGSVNKNGDNFEHWKKRFEDEGFRVVVPDDVPHNRTKDPKEKTANRFYYYNAIKQAHHVVVCNDVDYIGFETAMEVGYSYALNKNIYFTNINSEIDGVRSLLSEGRAKTTAELLRDV